MIKNGVTKYRLDAKHDWVGQVMLIYFDVNRVDIAEPLKFLWKESCELEPDELEIFDTIFSEALKSFKPRIIEEPELFGKIDVVLDRFRGELGSEYFDGDYRSSDIDKLYSEITNIASDEATYTLLADGPTDLNVYFETNKYRGLFNWLDTA